MKDFFRNLWKGSALGWRTVRLLLGVTLGLLVCVWMFEEKLIYFPSRYPEGRWDVSGLTAREGEVVPKIEDCHFTASDGVKLHGWFASPQRKTNAGFEPVRAEAVLLWFHGNAGNITNRFEMIRMLMQLPAHVFIIDYRGYGKSEGKPSEQGLYLDAQAAWDYLTRERGVGRERIIIFGKSLGGAPAIDLASKVEPAGLIVQSSFTSIEDMAASIFPIFPNFILRTKMDSQGKIALVRCPKLFIHSPLDEVVPYKLGRKLFEAAPEPKHFYEVQGALHNETYIVGGKPYLEALREFVNKRQGSVGRGQDSGIKE